MKSPSKAPRHLSPAAKAWWRRLLADFVLEDEGALLILQTSLEAFDRLKAAQAEIKRDGATIVDRFGQRKPHPLLTVERDSRSALLAGLRALHLDADYEPLSRGGKA